MGVGAGGALAFGAGPPFRAFGKDGNGFDELDEPEFVHEACLLTAERELCAVELFNLSTREAPTP